MAGYLPAHADVPVAVGKFWVSKFESVRPPNHNCEYLVRIWHIKVHKRGQTFRLLGKMSASNTSADRSSLTHVISSFGSS